MEVVEPFIILSVRIGLEPFDGRHVRVTESSEPSLPLVSKTLRRRGDRKLGTFLGSASVVVGELINEVIQSRS